MDGYATSMVEGVEHVHVSHPDIDGSPLVPVDALEHYQERGWSPLPVTPDTAAPVVEASVPDAVTPAAPTPDAVTPPVVADGAPADTVTPDTTAGRRTRTT